MDLKIGDKVRFYLSDTIFGEVIDICSNSIRVKWTSLPKSSIYNEPRRNLRKVEKVKKKFNLSYWK